MENNNVEEIISISDIRNALELTFYPRIDECFVVTDTVIKNLINNKLDEKIINILNSSLNQGFLKEEFEEKLSQLDLSSQQKELIMQYADIINYPDELKHSVDNFKLSKDFNEFLSRILRSHLDHTQKKG